MPSPQGNFKDHLVGRWEAAKRMQSDLPPNTGGEKKQTRPKVVFTEDSLSEVNMWKFVQICLFYPKHIALPRHKYDQESLDKRADGMSQDCFALKTNLIDQMKRAMWWFGNGEFQSQLDELGGKTKEELGMKYCPGKEGFYPANIKPAYWPFRNPNRR